MQKIRIFLLDVSASMNQPIKGNINQITRLTEAKKHLLTSITNLYNQSESNQIMIISVAEKLSLIYQGNVSERDKIETAINQVKPGGEPTNLTAAFELILKAIQQSNTPTIRSVDIITDGLINPGSNFKTPANTLSDQFGVRFYLYLIEPTEQGYKIASEIVRDDDDGRIEIITKSQSPERAVQARLSIKFNQFIPKSPNFAGLKC